MKWKYQFGFLIGERHHLQSLLVLKKGTKIILAKGYCRLVCVSIEDKQKVKIPELLRSSLQQFTILD